MSNTEIKISLIRLDGGTQPREEIDPDVIAEYRERMEEGDEFPPIILFYDGSVHWLADGFHRVYAAKRNGFTALAAIVKQGTQRDAQWYSFGANRDHGKRRDRGDIKRAIEAILEDDQWRKISQSKIAEHVGCGQSYVSEVASHLIGTDKISERPTTSATRNGKTYEMNTSAIGKAKSEKVVEVVDTSTGEVLEDAEVVTTTVKRQSMKPVDSRQDGYAEGQEVPAWQSHPALRKSIDQLDKLAAMPAYQFPMIELRRVIGELKQSVDAALEGVLS